MALGPDSSFFKTQMLTNLFVERSWCLDRRPFKTKIQTSLLVISSICLDKSFFLARKFTNLSVKCFSLDLPQTKTFDPLLMKNSRVLDNSISKMSGYVKNLKRYLDSNPLQTKTIIQRLLEIGRRLPCSVTRGLINRLLKYWRLFHLISSQILSGLQLKIGSLIKKSVKMIKQTLLKKKKKIHRMIKIQRQASWLIHTLNIKLPHSQLKGRDYRNSRWNKPTTRLHSSTIPAHIVRGPTNHSKH